MKKPKQEYMASYVHIGDKQYMKSFPYLGSKINASLDDEIINRIVKATDTFGKLHSRVWN